MSVNQCHERLQISNAYLWFPDRIKKFVQLFRWKSFEGSIIRHENGVASLAGVGNQSGQL